MSSGVPRSDLLRGQIAFAASAGGEAPALLLKAARQLESLDPALARETYLDAWGAAMFAGEFARRRDSGRGLPGRHSAPLRPRTRRLRTICCWTVWPSWSPKDAPRRHRC